MAFNTVALIVSLRRMSQEEVCETYHGCLATSYFADGDGLYLFQVARECSLACPLEAE